MKKFYTAADLPDAYIILNLLSQAGIEAHVFNENAQGVLGEIPFTHAYPVVWLEHASDRARAEEVIADYEASETDGVCRCHACGEENPINFQLCWRCGKPMR